MARTETSKGIFRIREGKFADAYAHVESLLTRKDVSKEVVSETLLVFEALMQKLIDWGLDEDTDLEISGADKLGSFQVKIEFEGKMFSPDDGDEQFIEDRVLADHDDRLEYNYHSGYNEIIISVSRGGYTLMLSCAVASLLAIVAYIPLSSMVDAHAMLNDYVLPLEQLYANAALMIGAPMTFFSLLKNMTNTYVFSKRNSRIRQLQARTLATSAFAILLAFTAFIGFGFVLSGLEGALAGYASPVDRTFADVVTSLVPPSIFEPFEALSPIPLMVVALLCTYAMCSAGRYFEALRHAMMTCYTLFSRMLHVVIAVLPVFCFLAIMDILLDAGIGSIGELLIYLVAMNLGILALFATYAIRLRIHGIKVVPFVRKLVPLLRENIGIGSAMDAAQYNIRYCSKVFEMDREMLGRNLPVLAEINLDGNCFIIMFFTLVFLLSTGAELSWLSLIGLAMLVLFLSLGAPNQPGSILIGTLIVMMYLKSSGMLCAAIYSEAFLGGAQNLINVIGDIVMVAIEDSKAPR